MNASQNETIATRYQQPTMTPRADTATTPTSRWMPRSGGTGTHSSPGYRRWTAGATSRVSTQPRATSRTALSSPIAPKAMRTTANDSPRTGDQRVVSAPNL